MGVWIVPAAIQFASLRFFLVFIIWYFISFWVCVWRMEGRTRIRTEPNGCGARGPCWPGPATRRAISRPPLTTQPAAQLMNRSNYNRSDSRAETGSKPSSFIPLESSGLSVSVDGMESHVPLRRPAHRWRWPPAALSLPAPTLDGPFPAPDPMGHRRRNGRLKTRRAGIGRGWGAAISRRRPPGGTRSDGVAAIRLTSEKRVIDLIQAPASVG